MAERLCLRSEVFTRDPRLSSDPVDDSDEEDKLRIFRRLTVALEPTLSTDDKERPSCDIFAGSQAMVGWEVYEGRVSRNMRSRFAVRRETGTMQTVGELA